MTTIHEALDLELVELYQTVSDNAAVIALSHHQRDSAPSISVTAVIHHGIDTDRIPLGAGDGGYVLFLGRMSPDKGVHRAIHVARAAGKQLLIAAKMWQPEERRYFAEQVQPLIVGNDVVYFGEVGGWAKIDLLTRAEALLNPIRWAEPFGLVMAEALAAGPPGALIPGGFSSRDHR